MLTPVSSRGPAPVDPDALGDDAIGQLARYWLELADAAGGVPLRSAFDPRRVRMLLARLIVLEHLGDDDFRYRLLGTEVDRFTKARYTGRRTSEIPGHGYGNRIHALYMATLAADRPIGMTLPYVGTSSICSSVRQIAVPFRTGEEPDQIISLIEFELRQNVVPELIPAEQRRLI